MASSSLLAINEPDPTRLRLGAWRAPAEAGVGRSLVLGSCDIRVCILGSYSLGWSAFTRKYVDSAAVPTLGKKRIRPDVLVLLE